MFYADFSFRLCSQKVRVRFTEYYHIHNIVIVVAGVNHD